MNIPPPTQVFFYCVRNRWARLHDVDCNVREHKHIVSFSYFGHHTLNSASIDWTKWVLNVVIWSMDQSVPIASLVGHNSITLKFVGIKASHLRIATSALLLCARQAHRTIWMCQTGCHYMNVPDRMSQHVQDRMSTHEGDRHAVTTFRCQTGCYLM